jgi:signal peptidase I
MKRWLKKNRGFLLFLVCFGVFRTAVADWNPIPSSSMRPTLLEGDVVLVNRLAYDLKLPLTDISVVHLAEPQRGDVITFTSPQNGLRLIKRLVGLSGDVIEMKDERLFVNGKPAEYGNFVSMPEPLDGRSTTSVQLSERIGSSEHRIQLLPALSADRSFGPLVVPADHYFFLGDNRDNSADSRYIGFVPRRLLIGRAHHVVVSADILGSWSPRIERLGKRIE